MFTILITFFFVVKDDSENVCLIDADQKHSRLNSKSSYEDVPVMIRFDYAIKKDYLLCSVINFLCCNMFIGLAAMILSIKSREQYRNGRYLDAKRNADIARALNIAGFTIGLVFILLIILYNLFLVFEFMTELSK